MTQEADVPEDETYRSQDSMGKGDKLASSRIVSPSSHDKKPRLGSVTLSQDSLREIEPGTIRKATYVAHVVHIKARSRKYKEKDVTWGWYINVPQPLIKQMKIKDGEKIWCTLEKII